MIQVYQSTHESDLLLAQWWAKLNQKKELKQTLHSNAHTLSGFFELFKQPIVLTYDTDKSGIWFAVWFEPIMSGAFIGMWVDQNHRAHRKVLVNFERIITKALDNFTVILGVTTQRRVVETQLSLGYTEVGKVAGLFDGQDAWLTSLNAEGWAQRLKGYAIYKARIESTNGVMV